MLDYKQIKIVKKNIHTLSLSDVAKKAVLPESEILSYLKDKWTKEKYGRYVGTQNAEIVAASDASSRQEEPKDIFNIAGFSFIDWMKDNVWTLVFLAVSVIVVYFNSLNNGFVSDDVEGLMRNKYVGDWAYLLKSPLGFLRNFLIFVVYHMFGMNAIWFRVANIISHILTVFVVYFLFSLTNKKNLALFGSLLFAIHPIIVESVTWLSGGAYTNYTLLLLLSFVAYLFGNRHKYLYVVSMFLFIVALFTSVNSVVFPAVLFLYEMSFSNLKTAFKKTIGYWLVLVLFGAFLVVPGLFKRSQALQKTFYQEKGMDNPIQVVMIAMSSYIALIFWPQALTLYHSQIDLTMPTTFLRIVFLSIYIFMLYWFWKKNKMIFFWLGFFFICLTPFMTPFRISWIVAERYVYMSSIAVFFCIAYVMDKLLSFEKVKNVIYILFIIIIVSLATRTVIRNYDWIDADTLYLSMENISYNDPKTHNNLGDVYGRRKDFEKSAYEFKKAIELKPNYGDAYFNLGNTYLQWGKDKWGSAEASYQTALSINPDIWQGYAQLAYIYYYQNKIDLAVVNIEKAVKLNNDNVFIYNLAAMIYDTKNDAAKTKEMLDMAVKLEPNNQMTKENVKIFEQKYKK